MTADSPITAKMSSMCSKTLSGAIFVTEVISEKTWFRVTPSFTERAHSTRTLIFISFITSSCNEKNYKNDLLKRNMEQFRPTISSSEKMSSIPSVADN